MTDKTTLISRRCGLCALAVALFSSESHAGSYLDRAAILLSQAGKDALYLRDRLHDGELAFVLHKLAETRVEAASRMHVPKEVIQAHPHLLLVLSHYERACAGARDGERTTFATFVRRALDEERTLRSVLKQLGWVLPEAP